MIPSFLHCPLFPNLPNINPKRKHPKRKHPKRILDVIEKISQLFQFTM